MAGEVERRLAWYLATMRTEELRGFRLQLGLPEKQVRGPASASASLAQPDVESGLEAASRLVAQYGEQQAWDLALRTWEQMGLSRLCAQARMEAALMSADTSWFPCSPSAPSVQSPSRPTSTEVLRFLQDPEGKNSRDLPDTSGHVGTGDPSWPLFQALPSSPDQESPSQESPGAPTSTAVLGRCESPRQPSQEPRKQEAPEPGWPLAEPSGNRRPSEALQSSRRRDHLGLGTWPFAHTSARISQPLPRETPVSPQCGDFVSWCQWGTLSSAGLRERNQNQKTERPSSPQKWEKEDLHLKFTQLLLLHRVHPRGHESLVKGSWHDGAVEKQGLPIELRDLFDPALGTQEEPRTVVLHGAAGVGKSTAARWVRRAWEDGLLWRDRFHHVVYVSCRELAPSQATSLSELVSQGRAGPWAPVEHVLSQPEHLLFILDDLGGPEWAPEERQPEPSAPWSQRQPPRALLGGLLGRRLLPEARLLVTARTTALRQLTPCLRQPRWVEVLGFSEAGRREYFRTYFENESQAVLALSLVESNQALLTLCLVPLVAWLACTCLRWQMERGQQPALASGTATALCLHYLSQALPARPLGAQLRGLCSLAAKGLWKGKSLFSWRDLKKHGLDGATVTSLLQTGVLRQHPAAQGYSLAPPCLQELLAAVSCALGDRWELGRVEGTQKLLEVYGRLDLFGAPTTCFLFGLLSEQGARAMEGIFGVRLPGDRRRQLLRWAEAEVRGQPSSLRPGSLQLLHCLYETQDEAFLSRAMAHFRGARVRVHTGVELLVFAFCVRFCRQVERLRLEEGGRHGHACGRPGVAL